MHQMIKIVAPNGNAIIFRFPGENGICPYQMLRRYKFLNKLEKFTLNNFHLDIASKVHK